MASVNQFFFLSVLLLGVLPLVASWKRKKVRASRDRGVGTLMNPQRMGEVNALEAVSQGVLVQDASAATRAVREKKDKVVWMRDPKEQEETLRREVNDLQRRFEFEDSLFSSYLQISELTFNAWKQGSGKVLLPNQVGSLAALLDALGHIRSMWGEEKKSIRAVLDYKTPFVPEFERQPLAPPWMGQSIREYLARQGIDAALSISRWLDNLKFNTAL